MAIGRRKFLKRAGLSAGALSLVAGVLMSCSEKEEIKKPNLIYVFPDQYRVQSFSFWSNPEYGKWLNEVHDCVHTPYIDQFAEQSVVFTQAISNTPICSPHRAMLMSGKYPFSNGVPWNCRADRPHQLDPNAECLSDVLKTKGYSCGYIGKWHLDKPEPNDPDNPGFYVDGSKYPEEQCWDGYTPPELRHGFDYWYSYGTFDVHKNPHYWDKDGNKHEPGYWSPTHEADKAISYLRNEEGQRDPDNPFCLMISMNPPHPPYGSLDDVDIDSFEKFYSPDKVKEVDEMLNRLNVPKDHKTSRDAIRYYFASITGVDREFGRILKELNELGLDENTIVVFASDHGEMMGSHGLMSKSVIYEEALRIPFIVRYPQMVNPGVTDVMMSSPDIMPSLLGLMGLNNEIPDEVEGRNLSEFIVNPDTEAAKPESAFYVLYNFEKG